ncbi:MAG: alpha-1,2-fucosyltransferase [Bacteroidia bacterium]|nr:alpha-1,2-fucosyltransferase [Bacteroidia bacterium]
MIIVKLTGGLGNQMFQYAAGRSLAEKHGADLKLDISNFQYVKNRNYKLHLFNINESFSTKEDVFDLVGSRAQFAIDKVFRTNFFIRAIRQKENYYRQRLFHYDEDFFNLPDNSYLEGYWQCEKYFQSIEEQLRKAFKFNSKLGVENEKLADKIRETVSVSIHVRRSDYFFNSKLHQVHGILRSDYYNKAINLIAEKYSDLELFVFSDDMEWVKEFMHFDYPTTYVENNTEDQIAHQDMELMSYCDHNIIANSSFSWWSAWLNTNPQKMVVAPNKWFKTTRLDTKDVIPESWIRI